MKTDLTGKICLVTGASDGIGMEVARKLSKMGAAVVMLCRNRKKGEAVQERIRQETGNRPDLLICDLASQADIRRAADDFLRQYPRLDVLVHNAGAFFTERQLSPDGIELQFAINHLAVFLLTHLLMPKIKAAPSPRIVVTSSLGHYGAKIRLDDPGFEKEKYNGLRAYKQSKLANVLFTYELARRLSPLNIPVNSLHPGVVKTSIAQKDSRGIYRLIWGLAKPFMVSLEKGAATTLYLAAAPEAAQFTAKFFMKGKPKTSDPLSYDETLARDLWELSEKLTGISSFQV